MDEYVFGANILENLTTGMYQDSRVIYREYIQNASDQIDFARKEGLLVKGKELIDIQLDARERTITITDNATGIPSAKFKEVLTNIADSDKQIGEAKGFRGIGRLCGLAYCRELVFSSKAPGETQINTLRCYASKMRELIDKNNQGEKISAQEVLNEIYEFSEPIKTKRKDDHWFKVELLDVNAENRDTRFLFTGDIGENAQRRIVSKYENESNKPFKIDLIKMPHHGSKVTYRFIDVLMPDYAVISASSSNLYGHPYTETLDMLDQAEVKLFRTDQSGDITVKSDGKRISVTTEKR